MLLKKLVKLEEREDQYTNIKDTFVNTILGNTSEEAGEVIDQRCNEASEEREDQDTNNEDTFFNNILGKKQPYTL